MCKQWAALGATHTDWLACPSTGCDRLVKAANKANERSGRAAFADRCAAEWTVCVGENACGERTLTQENLVELTPMLLLNQLTGASQMGEQGFETVMHCQCWLSSRFWEFEPSFGLSDEC